MFSQVQSLRCFLRLLNKSVKIKEQFNLLECPTRVIHLMFIWTKDVRCRWQQELTLIKWRIRTAKKATGLRVIVASQYRLITSNRWIWRHHNKHNHIKWWTGVNSRAIRHYKSRYRGGWSIWRCRTHLSHIKEFKIICLLVPPVNVRIWPRARVLKSGSSEPVFASKQFWWLRLNTWGHNRRHILLWRGISNMLELATSICARANICRCYKVEGYKIKLNINNI